MINFLQILLQPLPSWETNPDPPALWSNYSLTQSLWSTVLTTRLYPLSSVSSSSSSFISSPSILVGFVLHSLDVEKICVYKYLQYSMLYLLPCTLYYIPALSVR